MGTCKSIKNLGNAEFICVLHKSDKTCDECGIYLFQLYSCLVMRKIKVERLLNGGNRNVRRFGGETEIP